MSQKCVTERNCFVSLGWGLMLRVDRKNNLLLSRVNYNSSQVTKMLLYLFKVLFNMVLYKYYRLYYIIYQC